MEGRRLCATAQTRTARPVRIVNGHEARAGSEASMTVPMTPSGADSGGQRRPVPGEHERGTLTRFATLAAHVPVVPDGPGTMDAATIADRQREGGGAPNQRRPVRRGTRRNVVAVAFAWVMGA